MFHPSQLEQKYGGDAEDWDVYWPPKEVSKEYGVAPHKIIKPSKAEYDSSADLDLSDEDDVQISHQHKLKILNSTINLKNKLNPCKTPEIKIEEIKLTIKEEKESFKDLEVDNMAILPENSQIGKQNT